MGMKRYVVIVGALVAVSAVLALLFFNFFWVSRVLEERPTLAPDTVFKNYEGQEVRVSDFRGRALLINVWASWCPYCKEELPDFSRLQQEFYGRIKVLAVNRAEELETAKKYSDESGISNLTFLIDPSDSWYRETGGFSMPETIFIDQEGLIRYHRRGPMPYEEMRRRVEDVF